MKKREYKPRTENARGPAAKAAGGKRPDKGRTAGGRAERPGGRDGRPSFGRRDDNEDKPAFGRRGDKPAYGRREEGRDKPAFSRRDEKPAYGRREEGRDKPAYGRRDEKPAYGRREEGRDKPAFSRRDEKPAYGRREEGRDKPAFGRREDRPAYGRREESRDKPAFGRRDEKPAYGRREEGRDKPAFGRRDDRPAYGRKDEGRSKPAFGKRGEKPAFARSAPVKRTKFVDKDKADLPQEMPDTDVMNEDRDDRIEGRNPVMEALKSERPLNKIFIEKDNPDSVLLRIAAMARERAVPIQYVERRKLDMMSTTRIHQGVILEAAAHEYVEVDAILEAAAAKNEEPFIVILDGITDTNNMGSIIRSAECAGAHGIIIPKRRSATLNATVAKVAAGAQEFVPVARVTNLAHTIRDLKEKGIWITGSDMEGDRLYYESDMKGPIALVIGSEGEGISRVVKEECDYLVKIPMKGKISSLNAGVAAGLIMFEISKKRNS